MVPRTEPLQFEAEHYRKLYTCFSAFVLLYIPEPAFQDVPVGDELMEWLNTHFIEPSTQEGDELSSQERPWEDPAFWPYLTRYVILHLPASRVYKTVCLEHPSVDYRKHPRSSLTSYLSILLRISNPWHNSSLRCSQIIHAWPTSPQNATLRSRRVGGVTRSRRSDWTWTACPRARGTTGSRIGGIT